VEKMIMRIATKTSEKNALWLFPVPANPSSVRLNILSQLPFVWGVSLFSIARRIVEDIRPWMFKSQIYGSFYVWAMKEIVMTAMGGMGNMPGLPSGVTVHEHLEKGGVVAEKITAEDAEALYEYLQSKGLRITKGMLPMLDYYVGKDYTFIACWLSKTPTNEYEAQGIYVSFPSSQIYYPLLPTSAYGDELIPAYIYVVGYCTPQIPPQLKSYTSVDYYKTDVFKKNSKDGSPLDEFLEGSSKEEGFTLITIKSPARNFDSDLTMSPRPPFRVSLALSISRHSAFWKLFIFAICSCLASLIAGMLTLGRVKNYPLLFFSLGLFNILSIVVVALAVAFLEWEGETAETRGIKQKQARNSPTNPGGEMHLRWVFSPSWKMKLAFLVLFSLLFLMIGYLTTDLLMNLFEG